MTRILVVCLGNICRSPTAEAVLRAKAAERGLGVTIDSAGTGGWHVGDSPYGPAIAEGRARGYDLAPLRARQISAQDFARFDLILGMDSANMRDIEALRPPGNTTPVRLMTSYAAGLPDAVPDPYYTHDFSGALDLIERAADALLADVSGA
ncbi:MAG: low molecular weight protein-tyrosine-phosphatase [Pseudomonadota bacterium]